MVSLSWYATNPQHTIDECNKAKHIAHNRQIIERLLTHLKEFKLLSNMKTAHIENFDMYLHVAVRLVNLQGSKVKRNEE